MHNTQMLYDLIRYSDNYSNISRGQWQYYKDDANNNITQSKLFKFKIKITKKTPATGYSKDVKIAVRTLEMPLTNTFSSRGHWCHGTSILDL